MTGGVVVAVGAVLAGVLLLGTPSAIGRAESLEEDRSEAGSTAKLRIPAALAVDCTDAARSNRSDQGLSARVEARSAMRHRDACVDAVCPCPGGASRAGPDGPRGGASLRMEVLDIPAGPDRSGTKGLCRSCTLPDAEFLPRGSRTASERLELRGRATESDARADPAAGLRPGPVGGSTELPFDGTSRPSANTAGPRMTKPLDTPTSRLSGDPRLSADDAAATGKAPEEASGSTDEDAGSPNAPDGSEGAPGGGADPDRPSTAERVEKAAKAFLGRLWNAVSADRAWEREQRNLREWGSGGGGIRGTPRPDDAPAPREDWAERCFAAGGVRCTGPVTRESIANPGRDGSGTRSGPPASGLALDGRQVLGSRVNPYIQNEETHARIPSGGTVPQGTPAWAPVDPQREAGSPWRAPGPGGVGGGPEP